MTTKLEEKIKELEEKINSKAGGVTTNIYHAEGGGQSSATLDLTAKGDIKGSIKVYSNDIDGAKPCFDEALKLINLIPKPQPKPEKKEYDESGDR